MDNYEFSFGGFTLVISDTGLGYVGHVKDGRGYTLLEDVHVPIFKDTVGEVKDELERKLAEYLE